ncbi:sporulation integral membrane protein YlbJ [Bacillus coahuilensis]|uniref:sporulation integral membrane protein YlbJ n=1 Tax=Bacillus coahuilensis TaxID=408580 RepID=UPI0001850C04|nr:sporulation integral membrane protein YlbJ [Bacillus coahuilensis]
MNSSVLKSMGMGMVALILAVTLILFPEQSLQASSRGLKMWWEIVFPSLLPFFIIAEILIGFGVVRFIGVLLEPIMRPLFNVPGNGGFVWAMGMASGFPAGAKLSARLRAEGELTQVEAERLASFTNCSNPLFICGAVAVGFFHDAKLGILLAVSHYGANMLVGICMRYYKRSSESTVKIRMKTPSLKIAMQTMHQTRLENNKPLGALLGNAVQSSIQTLLMIGGFIILFSVVNQLLFLVSFTDFFSRLLTYILVPLQFSTQLSQPFISGMFEITLGSELLSNVTDSSLLHKAILTSFILGFGGFSVQAQVASILAQTDIRFRPFFFARILQGLFASVLTIVLWKPLYLPDSSTTIHAFQMFEWNPTIYYQIVEFGPLITLTSLYIYICLYLLKMKKGASN